MTDIHITTSDPVAIAGREIVRVVGAINTTERASFKADPAKAIMLERQTRVLSDRLSALAVRLGRCHRPACRRDPGRGHDAGDAGER
jgi:hypothetical protein